MHAASSNIDAYDPDLTGADYVRTAIEGEGGEVQAVVAECNVERELVQKGELESVRRCQRLSAIDTDSVRRAIWRVGSWQHDVESTLGSDASALPTSSDSEELVSVVARAPYPSALAHAWRAVNDNACSNSQAHMNELRAAGDFTSSDARRTRQILERRCQGGRS